MRKLILQCGLSPGDIVMLTAAVRDLHRCYPRRFLTDVRTACPELWEHNPLISALADEDPEVESISCSYPLINRCSRTPYHCLHGFIEFLNERLGLAIRPTAFRGDIHLSEQEKAWYSQVHELTGEDTPFWIIAAGGKYDVTIKWWDHRRYQAVVDHFRGKIQFVQVGQPGHHHPKLHGVIDLRGKTNLRQLVRLIYHAQGVLSPVTALMHLAAAVESRPGRPERRPCVVIAGAREPAHWEAYPDHQFIHTNGSVRCGGISGCWKDRVLPLRDGDERDRAEHRCRDVVDGLPRCMDLITAAEVIHRIELYYQGGALTYLSAHEGNFSQQGVRATTRNPYDCQALNLHSAGAACDRFIPTIPPYPSASHERGIVICGGGVQYFTCAWVCVRMLRRLGCALPIELWHLGDKELDRRMADLMSSMGVHCVDALKQREQFPARILHGWELKPYAILHSRFREVLLLDADNVPVVNPEFLFGLPEFRGTGAVFWPDYPARNPAKSRPVWRSCGLRRPPEPEFETGQVLVDKQRCWSALCLTMWFNENSDFYYRYIHGDKETFHLAFRKLAQPYRLVPHAIHSLPGTMCQHDFHGRRIFQHRNTDKWDLLMCNQQVDEFHFEQECRNDLIELRKRWPGLINSSHPPRITGLARSRRKKAPVIKAVMLSCREREAIRRQTLHNLAQTDWGSAGLDVQLDTGTGDDHRQRQARCTRLAIKTALESPFDYLLFLEDDLDFNRFLRHNLFHWKPLLERRVTLASLYNPGVRQTACDVRNRARLVPAQSVFGSQAFLLSRATAEHVLRNWNRVPGMQDIKISRLAGRFGHPVLYHAPSLVQHVGTSSVWGGQFHQAKDFDPNWKA
jgi:ADP-heptose:LPS heptosyltransferase